MSSFVFEPYHVDDRGTVSYAALEPRWLISSHAVKGRLSTVSYQRPGAFAGPRTVTPSEGKACLDGFKG